MYEVVVALAQDEAFQQLKKLLLGEKAKIVEEDPPKRLIVEHGSWLEYSPKTLQKTIRFNLIAEGSKTRIVSNTYWKASSMAWAVLTSIAVAIVATFCLWLAWNIRAYVEGSQIIEILALACFAILIVGLIHTIYLYSRRENFTKEVLALLPRG